MAGPSHKKGVPICKNVMVFKYMGPDIYEFTHSDKAILLTGINFELDSESEEIIDDIYTLIHCSKSHDYSSVYANDFEFIKCTGKFVGCLKLPVDRKNHQALVWPGRSLCSFEESCMSVTTQEKECICGS